MMSNSRRSRCLRAATIFGLVALAGCGDGSTGTSATSRVSLKLMDAPGDVKRAYVTISQVYLQGSNGRVVLRDTPWSGDLAALANSTADLAEGVEVPAGSYSELRFVISGGYIEIEGASPGAPRQVFSSATDYAGLSTMTAGAQIAGTLQMPSLAQSGLKVKMPGDGPVVLNDAQEVFLVDFDVARSYGRAAGQSGRWVMTPVIEASDFQVTGSARATVQLATPAPTLPQFNGSLFSLGLLKATLTPSSGGSAKTFDLVDADNDGRFEAQFRLLPPGQYALALIAPAGVTVATTATPTNPMTVTVGSNGEATVAWTVAGVTVP